MNYGVLLRNLGAHGRESRCAEQQVEQRLVGPPMVGDAVTLQIHFISNAKAVKPLR
jgi:hypothetical protein